MNDVDILDTPAPQLLRPARRANPTILALVACFLTVGLAPASAGQAGDRPANDYTEMSLEALMNLEIVSVSKTPEGMNDAAAAIFVITREDIRRSGAVSVPEILRMVPGLQVARVDASRWAVTTRGFNGWFANKLLVLVDGRSAYDPVFSGVFWENTGTVLADIERIEVLRGPGATLWGANAMNGVINIITRNASETVGAMASAAAGNEELFKGTARWGGYLRDDFSARVTVESSERDDSVDELGRTSGDGRPLSVITTRLDWEPGERDRVLFTGHYSEGESPTRLFRPTAAPPYGVSVPTDFSIESMAGTVRWSHEFSATSSLELQVFHTGVTVVDTLATMEEQTTDIEVRHTWAPASGHTVVLGAGYRVTSDDFESGHARFEPSNETVGLGNVFLQDSWSLADERLRLILGAKIEFPESGSNELQPNARVAWMPTATQTAWGSVSRAVRTPSRYERSVLIDVLTTPANTPTNPGPLPLIMQVRGQSNVPVEELVAYEVGYRAMPAASVFVDIAAFSHRYHNLRSLTQGTPEPVGMPPTHVVLPVYLDHQVEGDTWGVEVAASWRARPWWRLRGGLTYLDGDLELLSGDPATAQNYTTLQSPEIRWTLDSQSDLGRGVELDVNLEYVGGIDFLDVDPDLKLDARVGWRADENVELALVGNSLLKPETKEFVNTFLISRTAYVQRSIIGKVTLWF